MSPVNEATLLGYFSLPDMPRSGADFGEYSSGKPGIPLAQELEQVRVLVGQIQSHESLSWDVEHMNPNEVVQDPPCSRVRNPSPFLIWAGRSMLLEGRADAVFEGRIDEQTDGHHQQSCHHALGLFERARGGEKLGVFEAAKPALCMGLACIAGSQVLGGQQGLVECIGCENETTLLVNTGRSGRDGGGERPCDRVDHLGRLGALAWSSTRAIAWRSTHRDLL